MIGVEIDSEKYLSILDRAQAAQIFDTGIGHDEFVSTLNSELFKLHHLFMERLDSHFYDQHKKIDELINQRMNTCGHNVFGEYSEFVRLRRDVPIDYIQDIKEINKRHAEMSELISDKFNEVNNKLILFESKLNGVSIKPHKTSASVAHMEDGVQQKRPIGRPPKQKSEENVPEIAPELIRSNGTKVKLTKEQIEEFRKQEARLVKAKKDKRLDISHYSDKISNFIVLNAGNTEGFTIPTLRSYLLLDSLVDELIIEHQLSDPPCIDPNLDRAKNLTNGVYRSLNIALKKYETSGMIRQEARGGNNYYISLVTKDNPIVNVDLGEKRGRKSKN